MYDRPSPLRRDDYHVGLGSASGYDHGYDYGYDHGYDYGYDHDYDYGCEFAYDLCLQVSCVGLCSCFDFQSYSCCQSLDYGSDYGSNYGSGCG